MEDDLSKQTPDEALQEALWSGANVSVIYALLEQGANPNAEDEWGNSMLQQALSAEYKEAARILLEAGANPNSRGGSDYSPVLHWGVLYQDLDWITLLLERQADVNATNANGQSALMIAVQSGNRMLIRFLLEHGADANARDSTGTCVYDMARNPNKKQIRQLLLKGSKE